MVSRTSTFTEGNQPVRGSERHKTSTFSGDMIPSDDEVSTRTDNNMSKSAIEGSSKYNVDESAIEERDSDWEDDDNEDDDDNNEKESTKEASMFHRVESRSNLNSHRSLLTTALQEGDRTRALQNEASQSTFVITRTRTIEPNGPSIENSPQEDGLMMGSSEQKPKPIIMTTSNVHSTAMSPRTTRRHMFTQELTSSLRQNVLWEREEKDTATNAVAKRQQSAMSLPALHRAATSSKLLDTSTEARPATSSTRPFIDDAKFKSLNQDVYSAGLDPYHSQGW
jgi:hypothetical protein